MKEGSPSPKGRPELEKQRILSEAELVKGGAEPTLDEQGGRINMEVTPEQKTAAKIEMGEHFYQKSKALEEELGQERESSARSLREEQERGRKLHMFKEVAGIKLELEWSRNYDGYWLYFPQLGEKLQSEGFREFGKKTGVYEPEIRIGGNNENAERIFNYAVQLAETEHDIVTLYKKIEEYEAQTRSDSRVGRT